MNKFAWVLIPVLTLASAWAQAADSSSGAASASGNTLVLCGKVVTDGKKMTVTELYKPDSAGNCNKGDAKVTTKITKTKPQQ